MKLTANFYLAEFERSQTARRHGIDNRVPTELLPNLTRLCRDVLQPLRDAFGPVHITSGYRCPDLNRSIGGSPRSAHLQARAADLVVTGHSLISVAHFLETLQTVDKVILEFDEWLHVQIARDAGTPRQQSLTAYRDDTGTHYVTGLQPGLTA